MVIIRQGHIPEDKVKFICRRCGTVFEAGIGEYKRAFWHNGYIYNAACPLCGETACADESDISDVTADD